MPSPAKKEIGLAQIGLSVLSRSTDPDQCTGVTLAAITQLRGLQSHRPVADPVIPADASQNKTSNPVTLSGTLTESDAAQAKSSSEPSLAGANVAFSAKAVDASAKETGANAPAAPLSLARTANLHKPSERAVGTRLIWVFVIGFITVAGLSIIVADPIGFTTFSVSTSDDIWHRILPVGIGAAVMTILALFARYCRQLSRTARTLELAGRQIAEPQGAARDQLAFLSQAVRLELSAMNEGVERVLARATELESMVTHEVAAIERAYRDNEARIRVILQDLRREREIFSEEAEHIQQTISCLHLEVPKNIISAGEMVACSVEAAAESVSNRIVDQSQSITLALARAGDVMIDTINERASEVVQNLNHSNSQLSFAFQESSRQFTSAVQMSSEDIRGQIVGLSNSTLQMFSNRLERIAQALTERADTLARVPIGTHALAIDEATLKMDDAEDSKEFLISSVVEKVRGVNGAWTAEAVSAGLEALAAAVLSKDGSQSRLNGKNAASVNIQR